jgi:branched-chain amino acid transport system permease protein
LGTFLIVALPEMFRDFASARMLVFGLAMMIMMIVRPQGLLPPRPRVYDLGAAPAAPLRPGATGTAP